MDQGQFSRSTVTRRDVLKLLGAAGTSAALGQILLTYAPWLDYDEQVLQTWNKESTMPQQMSELIRQATLAPNGHNTQPRKFAIQEDTIQIHPDYSRRLPVVDPHDRELWISLGCAVIYPSSSADYIEMKLQNGKTPNPNALFDAISQRQNTRSLYDGKPLPSSDLELIQSIPLEAGVSTCILTISNQTEAFKQITIPTVLGFYLK